MAGLQLQHLAKRSAGAGGQAPEVPPRREVRPCGQQLAEDDLGERIIFLPKGIGGAAKELAGRGDMGVRLVLEEL